MGAVGHPEAAFCQILGEARLVTKQQGNIHKRAGGEAGQMGLRNRMPFFFVVARDLLGLKETSRGPEQVAPHEQHPKPIRRRLSHQVETRA